MTLPPQNCEVFTNGSIEILIQYDLGKKKDRIVVVNPRYF
jgi:hypothetical protein